MIRPIQLRKAASLLYFLPTSKRESPSIINAARPAAKNLLDGVDQMHLLIAHVPQFLGESLHISIHVGFHVVVQCKYAALFRTRRVSSSRARLSEPVILW